MSKEWELRQPPSADSFEVSVAHTFQELLDLLLSKHKDYAPALAVQLDDQMAVALGGIVKKAQDYVPSSSPLSNWNYRRRSEFYFDAQDNRLRKFPLFNAATVVSKIQYSSTPRKTNRRGRGRGRASVAPARGLCAGVRGRARRGRRQPIRPRRDPRVHRADVHEARRVLRRRPREEPGLHRGRRARQGRRSLPARAVAIALECHARETRRDDWRQAGADRLDRRRRSDRRGSPQGLPARPIVTTVHPYSIFISP